MKRDGFIIEEIIDYSNMSDSFDYVLRGRKKKTRCGRYLFKREEEVIRELQASIKDGSFTISGYNEYVINERGKERVIQSIPIKDRIALNAIMRKVEEHIHRRFIVDTAASIKGRGCHFLHQRVRKYNIEHPEDTRYMYKCDIRKFYHSIDQNIMMYVINRFFKDKTLIAILERCVRMLPEGLSIGFRSSQALGNLLLSYYVDHRLKDMHGALYFARYCDDMCVQSGSYYELTKFIRAIKGGVKDAKLDIKGNEQVFDTFKRDIDFLGYRTFKSGKVELRKHIKKRFARRWKRVKSIKRKRVLIASFYGMAKHADAKNLFKIITGVSMRKFSDLGIRYVPKNGKKIFNGLCVSLGSLVNSSIVIEDFEVDITTKSGDGRYLVQIKDDRGNPAKFFTNSEELKSLLDQAREKDLLPFETIIRREVFGQGKTKYIFT